MYVKKRNGDKEEVSFDKVKNRIITQSKDLKFLNPIEIAQKVCARIYDGVKTSELDELTSQICSSHITDHPEYGILASRIIISNHQKNTSPSFSETVYQLYNHYDIGRDIKNPLVSEELYEFVENNKEKLNTIIDYDRDYLIDYFGFKTLEKSYLLSINKKIIERPQHLFMRVSIGIHGNDLKDVLETYDFMSRKFFIHATPTLFNAGTPRPQMASCFLQAIKEDSIEGIFQTLENCAKISKYSGGIGLHIHNIRGKGSYIKGTNGESNGIIPMLSVFNKTASYVDQCFRGDTPVYTETGVTKIERLKMGEKVLTKEGSYKTILKVIKNIVKKNTLRIRTHNAIDTIYVTSEHQIYALQNIPTLPLNEIKSYIEDNCRPGPSYINVKDLTLFDYIGYPIPIIDNNVEEYNNDLCKISGIIFSNEIITNNVKISEDYEISFYREKGIESRLFLIEYLKEKNIDVKEITNKNYNIVTWKKTDNFIPISNYLSLNTENTISFLKGCLDANGCTINENYKAMFYNTLDKKNGYIIKYLFMKIAILVDGFYKANHNHYVICIPYTKVLLEMFNYKGTVLKEENLTYFKYDNILWTGIKSIDEMKEFNGMVYDLNIQDNHNYVTELGIVHNSGKRNGNMAIYLEPSHPDIYNFIQLRKNHGNEEERCRELFTALWIPNLFMERVRDDKIWSLFCPDKYPELFELYGEEYNKRYIELENENKFISQLKAQDLWKEICISQKETGTPYILYKDHCNTKSNQKNLGTIKSSNLCAEIIEYSNKEETAVCNLASIALPLFIENRIFNFQKLHQITQIITKNLNKVIDRGFYPIPEAERSNKKHRPLGIGVQGLADVYAIMGYAFESPEAFDLNIKIFETIYHGSLTMSNELAKKYGTYETYKGSPISEGKLQYDLWNISPTKLWDWDILKEKIKEDGVRNSLLISLMPTASTSQILGFNECFEPFTNNIYNRRTLAGEFFVINKYLINQLIELNLWNKNLKNKIMENGGSIQNISEIPDKIKLLFKTSFEIHPKIIINQSIARAPFICQSQSMNLFLEDPDITKISNIHFYSWKGGLKTGIYYLRTKPKAKMQAFTLEPVVCEVCSA